MPAPGPQKGAQITIPLDRLPEILERIVTDPETRRAIGEDPLKALGAFGIEFDAETRERLSGKTLAELAAEELKSMDVQRIGVLPMAMAAVATASASTTLVTSGVRSAVATAARTATTAVTTTGVMTVVEKEKEEPTPPRRRPSRGAKKPARRKPRA